MGGKSFAKPASRLTTSELNKLTSYCQSQLVNLFTRTERLRCITSKATHGDLDLLCAFDQPDVQIGQAQVGLTSEDVEPKGTRSAEREEALARLRGFCDDVSAVLGANGWVIAYYGYPIIALQVPFKQLDPSTGLHEEGFWQVDVALAPTDAYDAYLFSCSYNIPFALLVLATQSLSSSFWLKRDALCLRHRPYFGLPVIELTLIDDREELYRWLGLDMERWEAGFDSYELLYEWITANPAGSALRDAWDRVARGEMDGVKVEYKRFHTRVDGVSEFISWLKASRGTATGTPRSSLSAASRTSTPSSETAKEIPLDEIVTRLLEKSGQLPAYHELVQPLKLEAERVVQLHEKKRANRIRAKEDEERGRAIRAALALEEAAAKAREGEERDDGEDAGGVEEAGGDGKQGEGGECESDGRETSGRISRRLEGVHIQKAEVENKAPGRD